MSRVIIAIHGLGNKPPKGILESWWLRAMREGLIQIRHPEVYFHFELVYWADILHPQPLDPAVGDQKSPFYIEFPYIPTSDLVRKPPSRLRRKFLDFLEREMDKLFIRKDHSPTFNSVSNLIIRHYFQDLDSYYSGKIKIGNDQEVPIKDLVRDRLAVSLRKHRHKDILLIAHSMGSLIAYEVLSQMEKEVEIDTLLTVGSPLGQPVVTARFRSEFNPGLAGDDKPATPENIRREWINLSDLEDHIAMNYNLADDFNANSRGIKPEDKVVFNNYIYHKKRNPHKSYGYLRTPETAGILYQFLSRDRSKFWFWLSNRFHQFIRKNRAPVSSRPSSPMS